MCFMYTLIRLEVTPLCRDTRQYSLRELRARKKLTQSQMAKAIGVSTTTYNAWEKDLTNVAVGKVAKLAKYHGVRLDDIILRQT